MKHGRDGEDDLERGIALFNAGQYFAAHEIWEDWWRAATRPERLTIQGIIQIAVAMHHATTGNRAGAISVMERGIRNLEACNETAWYGVNLAELVRDARSAVVQLRNGQTITAFIIHIE